MREALERKETELIDKLLTLGSMVSKATLDSVEALGDRDIPRSRAIYEADIEINELRFEIQNEALITIATQQPMATDLRILAAVLDISSDLERMGDYAKGISKVNIRIGENKMVRPLIHIPEMAKIATQMLADSLKALKERDEEAARTIYLRDDEVDDLYEQVYKDMNDATMKEVASLEDANYLIWAAHNLERMADRVTNICEKVLFVMTGEMIELEDAE
jgi:phosphate transport system protein